MPDPPAQAPVCEAAQLLLSCLPRESNQTLPLLIIAEHRDHVAALRAGPHRMSRVGGREGVGGLVEACERRAQGAVEVVSPWRLWLLTRHPLSQCEGPFSLGCVQDAHQGSSRGTRTRGSANETARQHASPPSVEPKEVDGPSDRGYRFGMDANPDRTESDPMTRREDADDGRSGISEHIDQPVGVDQVPRVVVEIAAGAPIRRVWQNELGGTTYRIDQEFGTEFVKWAPDHPEINLQLEAEKLEWAGHYIRVPEVLGVGRDSHTSAWLRTRAISASSAVAPEWKRQPLLAARAIGGGLRYLHDRLDVGVCPWSWQVIDRAPMITSPDDLSLATDAPPIDRLVVCHGDACSPNTLIAADRNCAGHVDLGNLGLADRWADLAVATNSLHGNYDVAYEDELLDAYGIARDNERISYYRRLWDAT